MTPTLSSNNRLTSVFWEGLRRYKSVLIFYAALLLLTGPVFLVVDLMNANDDYRFEGLSTEVLFYLVLLAVAVILPLLLFSYINNRQAVDVYHALPVTRAKLYWGNAFVGLFILLIPYLVLGIICGSVSQALAPDNRMLQRILQIGLIAVALYSTMVFIMVNCGTHFESITYFGIFQIGFPFFVKIIYASLGRFTFGWDATALSGTENFLMNFSPGCLLTRVFFSSIAEERFQWMPLVQMLFVIGATLLGGMLLYRRRKSESAGSSFAFRPLFYIGALLISITGGVGFCLIMDGNSRFVVGLLIGVLCYFILDTIRNRGLGGVKETALVSLGAAVAVGMFFGVAVLTGTFGYERHLPPTSGVRSVAVYWRVESEQYLSKNYTLTDSDSIQNLADFHRQVIENRAPLRKYEKEGLLPSLHTEYERYSFDKGQYPLESYGDSSVALVYTMIDGRKVTRSYSWLPTVLTKPLYDIASSAAYQEQQWKNMETAVASGDIQKVNAWNLSVDWSTGRSEGDLLNTEDTENLINEMIKDLKARPADWNVHAASAPLFEIYLSPDTWAASQSHRMVVYENDVNTTGWLKQFGFSVDTKFPSADLDDTDLENDTGNGQPASKELTIKAESTSTIYRTALLSLDDYDQYMQKGIVGGVFHFAGSRLWFRTNGTIDDGQIKEGGKTVYRAADEAQYQALMALVTDHYITEQPWNALLVDNNAYLIYPENLEAVKTILAATDMLE